MKEFICTFELDVYDPSVQEPFLYKCVKALNLSHAKDLVKRYFLSLDISGEVISIEENKKEKGL